MISLAQPQNGGGQDSHIWLGCVEWNDELETRMNTISDLGVLTSIDYSKYDQGDDIGNDGHVCNIVLER